jgi:hypothetical protein
MIYCVRLYTVGVTRVPVFLAAFQRGGLWTDIARLRPGHVHTDLLRNPSDSTKFMSIEFWTSINTLLEARSSLEVRSFLGCLSRQAIDYEGLGMFIFPPQPGNPDSVQDRETCTSCLIGGKPSFEPQRLGAEVRS